MTPQHRMALRLAWTLLRPFIHRQWKRERDDGDDNDGTVYRHLLNAGDFLTGRKSTFEEGK